MLQSVQADIVLLDWIFWQKTNKSSVSTSVTILRYLQHFLYFTRNATGQHFVYFKTQMLLHINVISISM